MRIGQLKALGALTAAGLLAAGCSTERHTHRGSAAVVTPGGAVVVPEPTPPDRHEVIPAPPRTDASWVPGHWAFKNQRWIWIPGYWHTS